MVIQRRAVFGTSLYYFSASEPSQFHLCENFVLLMSVTFSVRFSLHLDHVGSDQDSETQRG